MNGKRGPKVSASDKRVKFNSNPRLPTYLINRIKEMRYLHTQSDQYSELYINAFYALDKKNNESKSDWISRLKEWPRRDAGFFIMNKLKIEYKCTGFKCEFNKNQPHVCAHVSPSGFVCKNKMAKLTKLRKKMERELNG